MLSGTKLKKYCSLKRPRHAALGARPVVAHDDHDGVVELAELVDEVEHPAAPASSVWVRKPAYTSIIRA